MIRKNGFTLAEVLITLGIIGVVAAMTIPNLITEHQKRATVTKLQRAISVINQAYKLSYDDVGELAIDETTNLDSREYFKTYWEPYIKVLSYCNTLEQCNYPNYWAFKDLKGYDTWAIIAQPLRHTFMTMEGFVYVIFLATWTYKDGVINGRSPLSYVIVDINGGAKPNQYGKDVFLLSRVQENGGGIRPYCYEKTDEQIKADCSTTGKGECCAERIRRAGWQIEKGYPWK